MQGTIVDLFCGCGGFSLGAELAGFRSIAAIDIEPVLQSAYRRNFQASNVVEADIRDLGVSAWRRIIGETLPDGVIGGPPCQGFSWIGKKRDDDPRNHLIGEFCRQIELLKPAFFVMENVEGLLHQDKRPLLEAALELLAGTYSILPPTVINAADVGAPTNRRRVVVIGYDPRRMDRPDLSGLKRVSSRHLTTIRDAIADLPAPVSESAENSMGWSSYPRGHNPISSYAQALRRSPPKHLGDHHARSAITKGIVSGNTSTRHAAHIAERYSNTPTGSCDPITKSHKLDWEGRSPTLRAGTGAEKGSFQAVRPLHPSEGRVITVREAARIQGFPDWFVFHPTKWHSFRMIGNSVSPIVSRAILETIAKAGALDLAA